MPSAGHMYCTPGKVRDSNELLNDDTLFTDERINPFINKAQTRIDIVLAKRYKVPLIDPVPAIVESIAQDMAAGFLLADVFANHPSQELLNLSNQFLKRAENDLVDVVNEQQLDAHPGVELAQGPNASSSPNMASTTPAPSAMEEILKQW